MLKSNLTRLLWTKWCVICNILKLCNSELILVTVDTGLYKKLVMKYLRIGFTKAA